MVEMFDAIGIGQWFRYVSGSVEVLGAVLLLIARLSGVGALLPGSVPARYPAWHVMIGELHFRLGLHAAAERVWQEALRLTTAQADQEFLLRRLALCGTAGGKSGAEQRRLASL